jgi:fatty acid desaturase
LGRDRVFRSPETFRWCSTYWLALSLYIELWQRGMWYCWRVFYFLLISLLCFKTRGA